MTGQPEPRGDRRVHPRYEYHVDVGILGLPPTTGVTVNISRGGVKVDVPEPVTNSAVGKECGVRFLDAGEELQPHYAVGVVRRVETDEGRWFVAIKFLAPLEIVGLEAERRRWSRAVASANPA